MFIGRMVLCCSVAMVYGSPCSFLGIGLFLAPRQVARRWVVPCDCALYHFILTKKKYFKNHQHHAGYVYVLGAQRHSVDAPFMVFATATATAAAAAAISLVQEAGVPMEYLQSLDQRHDDWLVHRTST